MSLGEWVAVGVAGHGRRWPASMVLQGALGERALVALLRVAMSKRVPSASPPDTLAQTSPAQLSSCTNSYPAQV